MSAATPIAPKVAAGKRRRDGICPDCNTEPRQAPYSYCMVCKRARDIAYYAIHGSRKKNGSGFRPKSRLTRQDSCNCGNSSCNGMSCDRVSA